MFTMMKKIQFVFALMILLGLATPSLADGDGGGERICHCSGGSGGD